MLRIAAFSLRYPVSRVPGTARLAQACCRGSQMQIRVLSAGESDIRHVLCDAGGISSQSQTVVMAWRDGADDDEPMVKVSTSLSAKLGGSKAP